MKKLLVILAILVSFVGNGFSETFVETFKTPDGAVFFGYVWYKGIVSEMKDYDYVLKGDYFNALVWEIPIWADEVPKMPEEEVKKAVYSAIRDSLYFLYQKNYKRVWTNAPEYPKLSFEEAMKMVEPLLIWYTLHEYTYGDGIYYMNAKFDPMDFRVMIRYRRALKNGEVIPTLYGYFWKSEQLELFKDRYTKEEFEKEFNVPYLGK